MLFTAAFALMGVRRILELLEHSNIIPGGIAFNNLNDIIALAISILMAFGVYLISGIFEERQQAQRKLQQQLDELRSFQRLSIGRELRMKELVEEIAVLRNPLSAEPASDIPVASGSVEVPRHAAEQHATTQPAEQDHLNALLFMLEDLEAGRKKIERAHQEWIAALDTVDDPIFLHDKEFRILRCNKAYQQRAGISFHEIIGQLYYEIFPKTGAPLSCCLRVLKKTGGAVGEEEMTVGDAIYRFRAFSVHDEHGVYLNSAHILEDITASRRAEAALHESEEKFSKITESAQDAIIMMGADQCISFWNAAAERIFGYTAEEALGQELHALIVPPPAYAKFTQAFPHFQASGKGPLIDKVTEGTALRNGGEEFPVELAISATQLNGQWHVIAIVRDITGRKRAAVALALANEELVFQNAEKEKRAAELTIANKKLQDSLEDTMRAITGIVEMRDPYTAGHQAKVANLATAIARQMGLPDEQAHAIHLAGTVHDLGKINIPAEILSKPGKITDIEYSLIKVHPQAGYDISKGITFPWPIAQMVLQHHERMDGSGYPQGLKGEAILLEARILAVADVVEAISAHRPYRPGLGIDIALEEITKNRGRFYDPQAVDACLALFREQGYILSA